jgi:ribosomal subunit interface protein
MKINITGKHMDLGESFQNHVEGKLQDSISKYIDRINVLEVVATKEGHRIRVDIHANTGTHSHVAINGADEAADVYAAFDGACEKVAKQLRRYKRRLTNHHKTRLEQPDLPVIQAKQYVLTASPAEEEAPEEEAPMVIAERPLHIEHLSVSDAVMRMDLANLPALMFYNSKTAQVNLVYRREDGNIAWVEPDAAMESAA